MFWPALFLVEGGDGAEAQEYSRLKGEKEAIERVSIQKKCAVNFTSAPTLQVTTNSQAQVAYDELEVPKPGDGIDGRLLFDLFKGNMAEGTIDQCYPGSIKSGSSKIQIQFRDLDKASFSITCVPLSSSWYVSEQFDAKWKIKENELCFYDVPRNESSFSNDCNPVSLNKLFYGFKRSGEGSLEFNMKGSGLPSSTSEQIERAVSRIKTSS